MANEITLVNNADLRVASVLDQYAYQKLVDKCDLRSHCYRVTHKAGSAATKIPQENWDDVMAAPGEATTTNPTALGDDAVTVTAARQTLRYDPSDEFFLTNGDVGFYGRIGLGLAMAYIRRTTDLIGQVIDGFTATAGTSGVDLTVDDFTDALFQLEDLNNDGTFYCTLTRKQFGDLRDSAMGLGGPMQFAEETRQLLMAKKQQGHQGSWLGAEFWSTNLLQDDGTDDWGALYSQGAVALKEIPVGAMARQIPTNMFLQVAPAQGVMWVEIQRISEDGLTKYVGAGMMGVALNDDDRGVTIQSAD